MIDTLAFARQFRNASTDDDRAAAIASFVEEMVRSQGDGAASRADAMRVSNEVAALQAKLDEVLEHFGSKAQTDAATIDGKVDEALARIDQKMTGDLARLDARLTGMAAAIDKKIETEVEQVRPAPVGSFLMSLFFAALTVLGVYVAMRSPWVAAQAPRYLGGVVTAPAAP